MKLGIIGALLILALAFCAVDAMAEYGKAKPLSESDIYSRYPIRNEVNLVGVVVCIREERFRDFAETSTRVCPYVDFRLYGCDLKNCLLHCASKWDYEQFGRAHPHIKPHGFVIEGEK